MLRSLLFLVVLATSFLLVGFQSPQQADFKWLAGKWTGTEVYTDDADQTEKKYNLAYEATEQLGRFQQLDLDFTADDPELKDKFRLMLFWDKAAGKYHLWYFESNLDDDDPIYELDDKFLVVGKESVQWGDDEQRLKLVRQGDELVFSIEDANDDGTWEPNSTIHLKPVKD